VGRIPSTSFLETLESAIACVNVGLKSGLCFEDGMKMIEAIIPCDSWWRVDLLYAESVGFITHEDCKNRFPQVPDIIWHGDSDCVTHGKLSVIKFDEGDLAQHE
jgi:hypothetical protein